MLSNTILIFLFTFTFSCNYGEQTSSSYITNNTSPQDDCNGPDSATSCCFVNMPDYSTSQMHIPYNEDDGEKLLLTGQVIDGKTNQPLAGVWIYAYHTDKTGYYSKTGNETGIQQWHGRMHGWCITDEKGNYEIHTIRPAPYPTMTMPAHIHVVIQRPEASPSFRINDFVFSDDQLVTEKYRAEQPYENGGDGVVDLEWKDNIWLGNRNIVLD